MVHESLRVGCKMRVEMVVGGRQKENLGWVVVVVSLNQRKLKTQVVLGSAGCNLLTARALCDTSL